MALLLYTMVIGAFWPLILLQQGGMLSVAGVMLFVADAMLVYHTGKVALQAQRWFGIPHPLCGFGMIIAPIFTVGGFNLAIIRVLIFCSGEPIL